MQADILSANDPTYLICFNLSNDFILFNKVTNSCKKQQMSKILSEHELHPKRISFMKFI